MKNHRSSDMVRYLELRENAERAGLSDDELFQDYLEWARSPLAKGRHAHKFLAIGENLITEKLLHDQIHGQATWPHVDPSKGILIGYANGVPLYLPLEALTRHLLVHGPIGAGKTTFLFWVVFELQKRGIRVFLMDHKSEARRLQSKAPLHLIRPSGLWYNPLQPIGDDSEAYYAALCQEFSDIFQMHPGTQLKLTHLLLQLEAGLVPGESYPSLYDLKRVLEKLSKERKDQTLRTASMALGSLERVLGKTAQLRSAPHATPKEHIIALECLGLPPRIVKFLSAVHLLRLQMGARASGHGNEGLEQIYLSDEGSFEFSANTSNSITPQQKLFTQVRSMRVGVFVGVQTLGATDPIVKSNAGTYICLKAQGASEQREAAQLLGLPVEQAGRLGRLRPGQGVIRSPLSPDPVFFEFPHFDLGDYPSDEELAPTSTVQGEFSAKDQSSPLSYSQILGEREPEPQEPEQPKEEEPLPARPMQDWLEFLEAVQQSTNQSVTALYKQLGWSTGRGNRIKSELIGRHYVRARHESPVGGKGGRPRVILDLTESGESYLEAFGES